MFKTSPHYPHESGGENYCQQAMAKRLTEEQVQELKLLVIDGYTPEEIAKRYNIAVSSVHNYKNRFRRQGIEFPSVRGYRPGRRQVETTLAEEPLPTQIDVAETENIRFVVNGIIVDVEPGVQRVHIDKNKIEITY